MATNFFYGSLETLINKAISLDPIASHRLGELSGQSIAVHTTSPRVRATIYIQDNHIIMHNAADPSASALVTGPLPALLRQAASESGFSIGGSVEVSGDLDLLQALHEIARELDMDWEEPLAQILGDPIAHQVGQIGRNFFKWGKRTANNIFKATAEYARDDAQAIANKDEVDEFNNGVDELALGLDRLEARVKRQQDKTVK